MDWQTISGAALGIQERRWLKDTAEKITTRFENPVIVNIGNYRGASLHCLRAGARDAILIGIDIKPSRIIREELLGAEIITADSTVCHSDFKRDIHFLFIDGDHGCEVVTQDIANWIPKVVSGGIIAFHDYTLPPPRYCVGQALDEWEKSQASESWMNINAAGSIKAFKRL